MSQPVDLRVYAALSGETIMDRSQFPAHVPLLALLKFVARHLRCPHEQIRLFFGEHELLVRPRRWTHGLQYDGSVTLACLRDGASGRHSTADNMFLSGDRLRLAPEELQADRAIAQLAVESAAGALQHVSAELRGDEGFVRCALAGHTPMSVAKAVPQIAPGLMACRNFVLWLVRRQGLALEAASPELKDDREVVLVAVKSNGGALQHASEALRDDREIVLAAVHEHSAGLKSPYLASPMHYAGPAVWAHRESVLEFIRCGCVSIRPASEAIRSDRAVLLELMRRCGDLDQVPTVLRSDREIVMTAVTTAGDRALRKVPYPIRFDREVLQAAAESEGRRCTKAARGA